MLESLEAVELRRITDTDVPWVLSLSYERYLSFDPGRTIVWLLATLRSPTALAIRTDHAFAIANIITSAWHPKEHECHIVFLCAADGYHWEAIKLLRQSIGWARGRGCIRWWVSSETEYRIDALAKRVGARPAVQRWLLDLTADESELAAVDE